MKTTISIFTTALILIIGFYFASTSGKPCENYELVFIKHPAVQIVKLRSTSKYSFLKFKSHILKSDKDLQRECQQRNLSKPERYNLERLLRLSLDKALELSTNLQSISLSVEEKSTPPLPKRELSEGQLSLAREILKNNCGSCHGRHSPVVWLPLDNPLKMAGYKTKEGHKVRDHLLGIKAPLMPPRTSGLTLKQEEKALLLALLNTRELIENRARLDLTQPQPEGSVFMDFLAAEKHKWQGVDFLKQRFQRYLQASSVKKPSLPSHLIVPFGRSLQRHKTDLENPREIIAFDKGEFMAPTYIGFSPNKKMLEIISWNQENFKFDYFVADSLIEGKALVTSKVQESSCRACHQSGSPIFSRHPWAEVPFLNSQLKDRYEKLSNKRLLTLAKLGNPFTFDGSVRNGQKILAATKLCTTHCREDKECFKQLREWAEFRTEDNLAVNGLRVKMASGIITLEQRSSVLPDRDPLLGPGASTLFFIVDKKGFKGNIVFRQTSSSKNKNANLRDLILSERFKHLGDITYREELSLLALGDFFGLGARVLPDPLVKEGSALFPRPFLDYGDSAQSLKRLRPYFRNCF